MNFQIKFSLFSFVILLFFNYYKTKKLQQNVLKNYNCINNLHQLILNLQKFINNNNLELQIKNNINNINDLKKYFNQKNIENIENIQFNVDDINNLKTYFNQKNIDNIDNFNNIIKKNNIDNINTINNIIKNNNLELLIKNNKYKFNFKTDKTISD